MRAHDGAHVGHHQVEEGLLQIGDFIGGAAHVEHLVESDAVDGDRGVVAGDDLLPRHVDDLLHHIELAADRVDVGEDEAEAWRQGLVILAKTLDGVVVALRHLPNAHQRRHDRKRDDDEGENADPFNHGPTSIPRIRPTTQPSQSSCEMCF